MAHAKSISWALERYSIFMCETSRSPEDDPGLILKSVGECEIPGWVFIYPLAFPLLAASPERGKQLTTRSWHNCEGEGNINRRLPFRDREPTVGR